MSFQHPHLLSMLMIAGCAMQSTPLVTGADAGPMVDAEADSPSIQEGDWAISGTTLRYRIVGTGAPVVLLHGGPGGNMNTFASLEPTLGSEYQLVMYDQRGSGESARLPIDASAPDTSLISVERHVEDLEEIRRHLGIERLVLLGHSWGATLAVFYAARYPDHVERMVVYDGGPVWGELRERYKQAMDERLSPEARAEVERQLAEVGRHVGDWTQDELDAWFVEVVGLYMPTLVCDPSSVAPDTDIGRGGFWANQLTNTYEDSFDPEPFLETLSRVQAPVLLTHGRCEPCPIERVTVLRDALPNAELVIFEQSGHQAMEEEPELFLQTIRTFLARPGPGASEEDQ